MTSGRKKRAVHMGELVVDAATALLPDAPATGPTERAKLLDALTAVEEYLTLLDEVEGKGDDE